MHEFSIVEAVIGQVREELAAVGQAAGRVARVELSIGRLSGVNCDSVRFAFEVLAPGTPVEGAEIVIQQPKVVCQCGACRCHQEIDELVVECPRCGSPEVTIEGGRDMMLQSIEVEELSP
jgi:hydrogenase nickel incorporation protein HypA/HybF